MKSIHLVTGLTPLIWAVSAALMFAGCADAAVTVVSARRIHTMNPAQPQAQALAFDAQGKILAVGETAALLAAHPGATRLEAGDATIIPGLIDAHAHMAALGELRLSADLTGSASKQEALARLRAHAQRNPGTGWLIGFGWDQNRWPQRRFPNAADLDALFPDRPVWLSRIDGHAGWANSAALRAVGRDLSGDWQPDGGRIMRDARQRPTGIMIDAAMALVDRVQPAPAPRQIERMLSIAAREAVANGLTGVHDAGVSLVQLRAYQRLADRGQLPLRIYAMARGDGDALEELCRNGPYQHRSGRLQMRSLKLFADGALGSRGAAMREDYSDEHGNRGILVMAPERLQAAQAKAKRCGIQVATHAIGDRGNQVVLDSYAKTLGDDARSDHRWRIEHAQVLASGDLRRFAELRLIASMQPTHATSDMSWAEERLGPRRIAGAYAWRKLRDIGVPLALGSDFPVEQVDPRLGLASAVTRADAQGRPHGGWYPQERLTAFEALRGFTLAAAHAGFVEHRVGSLEPGKRADFVILAQDPLAIAPARLRGLQIRATYVDGKPVYQAEAGQPPKVFRERAKL